MDRDKGKWFVIHTLSGQENRVKDSIERKMRAGDAAAQCIYEVLVPTEKVSEVRQGKKTTTNRKYFPGYILVRMDLYDPESNALDEACWYFIRDVQGVIGFVGGGEKPIPLMDKEVEDLLMQVADKKEKVKPKIKFEIGENVRIKDGAFENFEGSIQDIDPDRGKLKLLVSIFGRSTPVELEFWQVERE